MEKNKPCHLETGEFILKIYLRVYFYTMLLGIVKLYERQTRKKIHIQLKDLCYCLVTGEHTLWASELLLIPEMFYMVLEISFTHINYLVKFFP